MLQFCQRACPIPNGTAAELLPKPALHRYGDNLSLPNMVTTDATVSVGCCLVICFLQMGHGLVITYVTVLLLG